ncbi:MAG: DUF2194 domain-containing protein [Balneolaceae bacterium]
MLQRYLSSLLVSILVVGTLISCEDGNLFDVSDYSIKSEPVILVLKNRKDDTAEEISLQIVRALEYTKIPYKTLDLGLISDGVDIPKNTRVIINTSYLINEISNSDNEKLVRFAAKGGTIVFTSTVTYDNFAFLQGIKPLSDYLMQKDVKGLHFHENILPNFKGRNYGTDFSISHDGIARSQFNDNITIYASAKNDTTYPVILGNKVGLGEVLTINSNIPIQKDYRGILFSTILKGLEGIPYSIANVGTIFLDDFPAPLTNVDTEPIFTEYGIDQANFVTNVWWPDTKEFADEYNIDYSAMMAFNYNAIISPPFDFEEWQAAKATVNNKDVKASIYLARDVAQTRHELAFHGYNHFSLWLEDWDNMHFMEESLQSSRKRWRIDRLGDLPTTYVPPTNYIDSVGVQAVIRGMPSIKVLSSLYLGIKEDGGAREFGSEPYNFRLFDYPRITSGYTVSNNSLFDQQNLQLLTGIWTHFFHPDDVFQITQRKEDAFESRNPLGLGWRTSVNHDFGLYDVFKQRFEYTKKSYPFIRMITAERGARVAQDWLQKEAAYIEEGNTYKLITKYPSDYATKSTLSKEHHWFMFVPSNRQTEIEEFIHNEVDGFAFTKLWNGYLYQFYSAKDTLNVPNLNFRLFSDPQATRVLENKIVADFNSYNYDASDEFNFDNFNYTDTRLKDAIAAYERNRNSLTAQEQVITLSVEFSQVQRAIRILEARLYGNPTWTRNDVDRLIMYYGWESELERAEEYLEKLWAKYPTIQVIDLKNKFVAALGFYSEAFVARWLKRELELDPDNKGLAINYLSSIENQENWPIQKKGLLELININPNSDSLYAYTLQRSFYYENADSTLSLVDSFPSSSHPQLVPFATDLANLYGYTQLNYSKALYWANLATGFSPITKLEWIAQTQNYDRYYSQAKSSLSKNPNYDSLRVIAGNTLFYAERHEQAYEILYPLFQNSRAYNTSSDTLITEDLRYKTLADRKRFYSEYPAFFSTKEINRLYSDYRWIEGPKVSVFGDYKTDNFDNSSGRGGISIELGNRRDITHAIIAEDLFTASTIGGITSSSNYQGLGYLFHNRSDDYKWNFQTGANAFFGYSKFLGEVFTSLSYNIDSTFTTGKLSLTPVLTQSAIAQNIYNAQAEIYREDFWFGDLIVTTASGTAKYYTNNVFEYNTVGRAYLQPWNSTYRGRLITELSYSDASKSFASSIPYYTPQNKFVKGVGLDFRFRNPNDFDYRTLVDVEVLGKHEQQGGYFVTGRATLEHKFTHYWEFKVGTDFSTSKLYRSNSVFITISHYFRKKLFN